MKVTRRTSPFLKQFSGASGKEIVCFRFWQAVIASGCPGECAYCFLQTQYPYRTGLYDLKGTLFSNLEEMVPEVKCWLSQPDPAGLILGENQDGLAFEGAYRKLLGITPLQLLIPLFRDQNPHGHLLIVLSKFTTTRFAEEFGPMPNVVFSWSLSLPTISERYEKKVAPLERRLGHAARLKRAGYRVRFRLDAMAPIPTWREEVDVMVERINAVGPEMLTIGALRATNPPALRRAAQAQGRDGSIFDYIVTRDSCRFKYRTEDTFHREVFRRVLRNLDPSIALGLCKEELGVWRQVGLPWRGCHCLHGGSDPVVKERTELELELLGNGRRQCPAEPAGFTMLELPVPALAGAPDGRD
jgi:DNA repair photolyase